jgi:CubicO group peptidase (beta-lactamase class C family)
MYRFKHAVALCIATLSFLSTFIFCELAMAADSMPTSTLKEQALLKDPLPRLEPTRSGFTKEGIERIDRFFEGEIAVNKMPGAVLAVAHHGKLLIYKTYGYQDPVSKSPMKLDTQFHLASMTKVMATVGALSLFEEGKLPINAPISNWFEEFKNSELGIVNADATIATKPVARAITVQDLMRHTNGMPYGERGNTPVHKLYPPSSAGAAFQYDSNSFIKKLAGAPLLWEPGTVWEYGFGIDVLGLIEEKIEGTSLENILKTRIWSKLGMSHTTFHPSDEARAKLAQPFELDPLTGKPQRIAILKQQTKFDCGGSCSFSTAGDYLRFGQMLLNKGQLEGHRVLSPNTVKFMTADHLGSVIKNNVISAEPGRAGYTFGLGVAVRNQRGVAAVNGNIGEFSWNGASGTLFWVDPVEELVVVMMAATPGELRRIYREKVPAVIYGAMN